MNNEAAPPADYTTTKVAQVSIRGGTATILPTYVRSAQRMMARSETRGIKLGFRIVLYANSL